MTTRFETNKRVVPEENITLGPDATINIDNATGCIVVLLQDEGRINVRGKDGDRYVIKDRRHRHNQAKVYRDDGENGKFIFSVLGSSKDRWYNMPGKILTDRRYRPLGRVIYTESG